MQHTAQERAGPRASVCTGRAAQAPAPPHHTHTASLPASVSWRQISELLGVSSREERKTGTVAAANELPYHRY